jgi:hypothetical protein
MDRQARRRIVRLENPELLKQLGQKRLGTLGSLSNPLVTI